jgi:predicted TIM-barrel fold metal-dependent hydrolase
MKVFDCRARPSLKDYMTFFDSAGAKYTMKQFGFPVAPVLTLEQFVAHMDEAGVGQFVFTGRDVQSRRGWRFPNEGIAEAVQQYPDRVIGFAGIDPLKKREAILELDRCIKDFKLRGVSLDPSGVGRPANDPIFYPIYERCVDYGIPIALTLGPLPSPTAGPMRVNDPMAIDDVACDFPDLRIICSHLGWPWVTQAIAIAWRHPHVYLETSMYSYMPGADLFVEAANTHIGDKVIFASGYPFNHPVKDVIAKFKTLAYTPEVLEKVLYKNGPRALGLLKEA